MNVRRWLYDLIDDGGTKHREVIHAASKSHARDIARTRCKNNAPLIDRTGAPLKACHAKLYGRIVCID